MGRYIGGSEKYNHPLFKNKQIEPEQSEFYRIPSHTKSLTDEQVEDVVNLIEKMEEDEDVLNVFHNMDMN